VPVFLIFYILSPFRFYRRSDHAERAAGSTKLVSGTTEKAERREYQYVIKQMFASQTMLLMPHATPELIAAPSEAEEEVAVRGDPG
jgi:hypothetical protein